MKIGSRRNQCARDTTGVDPVWLDFYDASRLPGFVGYSQLIAEGPAEAAVSLERALSSLDANAAKQRSVLLFDLATAHASEDAERAADYVSCRFDALEGNWYATAAERIPAVRKALGGTSFVAELEDRTRALSTT